MTRADTPRLFEPRSLPVVAAAAPAVSAASSAAPTLMALARGLARQWKMILGILALSLLAGFLIPRWMTPVYQGVATILIEANKSKIVSIDGVYDGFTQGREYLQTQFQFLRSREVGLRVVREMGLVDNPLFGASNDDRRAGSETDAPAQKKPAPDAGRAIQVGDAESRDVTTDPREETALQIYSRSLDIEPVRQSQLANIRFDSPDPVLAARIANKTAEAYIAAEMDMRLKMTLRANTWLSQRLGELKEKVDASEKAVAEYRESANLVGVGAGAGTGNAGGAGQQIETLTQRLTEARTRKAEMEQAYAQVRPGAQGRENSSLVLNSTGVARAKDNLASAQARFNAAQSRFGQGHPAFREAERDVQLARTDLAHQIESVFSSVSKDYQAAVATEAQLQRDLDQLRNQARLETRKEAQLATLEQDLTTNRQLYQTFLSRMKETATAADVQTPVARLVDEAAAPGTPIKPRKVLILALSGLIGLLTGLILAIIRMQVDDRIRSLDGLDREFGVPVISALPPLPPQWEHRRGQIVVRDPASSYSEMVRMAAASLHFATLDRGVKSIAVTSAVANEGKSTVASNLAFAMAKTLRVLLIDGDLRRANVHRLVGVPADAPGLAQVLRGEVAVANAIYRVAQSDLFILPAGEGGAAGGLISPTQLRLIVEQLEPRFDVVLIDSPPLEVISDAMVVCGACSSAVLVVRSGMSVKALVKKALARLDRIHAPALGIIVNGHDYLSARRFYGESSGYGDYEGYYGERGGQVSATVLAAPVSERTMIRSDASYVSTVKLTPDDGMPPDDFDDDRPDDGRRNRPPPQRVA